MYALAGHNTFSCWYVLSIKANFWVYGKTVYVTSTTVDSMLIPSYSTAKLLFKIFVTFKPLVHLVETNLQRCVFLCTCLTKPAVWLPASSSHLISVSPNWQRHAAKKVRSFIPYAFIIDRILPEICESQTSIISVPGLVLADRAIYSARVLKKSKFRPTRAVTLISSFQVLNGCEDSLWGGALSSQAWRMLYKAPGAVYRASYKEPLDQSDSWKLFDQLWNYTKLSVIVTFLHIVLPFWLGRANLCVV